MKTLVTATFEMRNGSVLKVEYAHRHWPGTYWEPPEDDVSDPTFYIDDVEVAHDKLPRGLDFIAEHLYEADPLVYGKREESNNEPDYSDYDLEY